ncbi:N-acetylglucosamine kinase [Herbiconiux solani]|uniref:N-acetylglucosamine kinase n=1 Tax=Herbiconiux solani TaxID=661329 RepID=UPI0008256A07|nr:BadF/BadG/BcrA/BcrD ATPase family protein [Herbiconiux solani]
MTLFIGLDIGGTKAAVRAEDGARRLVTETTLPSHDWDAEPVEHGVAWIAAALETLAPALPGPVSALGIGAQGLDNTALMLEFGTALTNRLRVPTVAVNDAALIAPAAGLEHVIGLIAGTGAIGVGWDEDGSFLTAGGWGSVIGDDAGAAGIVREAVKRALARHDDGIDAGIDAGIGAAAAAAAADSGGVARPDGTGTADPLLSILLESFGVADAERLARAVNDDPTTENWGPHAPAVFRAAENGSVEAALVIDGAASHLARLVDQLLAHGAIGSDVIAAGSVVTAQPVLFDRMSALVTARHPGLAVALLDRAPVTGAVELAARLVGAGALPAR